VIRFQAAINAEIAPLDVVCPIQGVVRCEVSAADEVLSLLFETHGVFVDDGPIIESISSFAHNFAARLALESGARLRDFRGGGSTLPRRGGGLDAVSASFAIVYFTPPSIGASEIATATAHAVHADYGSEQLLVRQYAFANGQQESVSRFVLLYGVCLLVAGDDQETVDAEIERHEPTIAKAIRPPYRGKVFTSSETEYTRLRNELAHAHDRNVDFVNVERQITACVDRFALTVKLIVAAVL
jgi:hypothetical protein